ncbi:DUF1045 domain-containing protein [Afipia clevelandensis]|uniref:Phosphonate metabolism protein n=1 Tax=Afipia clevelandensis ATCC 49720 TaxID=883079 RepID=K8PI67_9BRAD|nr:DUF1045 domain-containing protein [Afipia clevelandensis]EKS42327.1 hypothetical protein HMPREF9696_00492 [Afipia clevelandensis ATCC 49720]
MSQYPRYAIYFVPAADSVLYRFGASLIGYDAYAGQPLAFAPNIESEVDGWARFTGDPRKYGFHATLKAPIALAANRTEGDLISAMAAFARTPRAIPVITPTVRSISSFIAVVPDPPCEALQAFARDCVTAFDGFRAPLTAADRERRNASVLSGRQIAHLDRWGYPYVMDDFRFHMTLAGSLPADRLESVTAILRDRFAALNLETIAIDRLALLRQDGATTRFTIVHHWPLTPARA